MNKGFMRNLIGYIVIIILFIIIVAIIFMGDAFKERGIIGDTSDDNPPTFSLESPKSQPISPNSPPIAKTEDIQIPTATPTATNTAPPSTPVPVPPSPSQTTAKTQVTTAKSTTEKTSPPVTDAPKLEKINLNTATKTQLTTLNGIGEVKAQAILDYIKENGKLSNIEQIKNVKGIGEKTFENIKEFIFVEGKGTETTPSKGEKININTASLEELQSLKGIGEVKAKAIISHRANSPFTTIEEIKNVKGIGDKTFEDIKDNIEV